MELEAGVQQRAAAAGAPVPHILAADNSPAALGNPYLICDAIGGETIVRRIQRALDDAGRERLLGQCAQALAADPPRRPGAGWAEPNPNNSTNGATGSTKWATPQPPSSGRSVGWPRIGPPPSRQVLVHGDFRMGNLIVDEPRASRPCWTGSSYTSARCTRTWHGSASEPGASARPEDLGAGGLGSVESFLSAYEAAAGTELDRDVFRWWLTVATLRWGVICRFQAERHLSGQTPSVELAAIGRRVAETEWDVLDLLEGGGPR